MINIEKQSFSYTKYISGTVSVKTDYDFSIVEDYNSNTDHTDTRVTWADREPYSRGTVELEELETQIIEEYYESKRD